MWPSTFEARFQSWHDLRGCVVDLPKSQCLEKINQWWFQSPWSGFYLHWDDKQTWPNPWQLLEDNIFCSLARGLGMLYTISLLDRDDLQQVELVETKNDNLVSIDEGIYVLNWCPNQIVNIGPGIENIRHRIQLSEANQLIL